MIFAGRPYRYDMGTIHSAIVSIFAIRFRSRASLELKLGPGRPQLSSLDRLLWVWLYRIWPQVIDAMVLVKPATVVQWHRKGLLPPLALAIRSATTHDRHRNPCFDPPHEQGQPVVGCAPHSRRTA